jgi:hypothetical protein
MATQAETSEEEFITHINNLLLTKQDYVDIIRCIVFYVYRDVSCNGDVVIRNILRNTFDNENNIIDKDFIFLYSKVFYRLKFIINTINKLEYIIKQIEHKIHRKIIKINKLNNNKYDRELSMLSEIYDKNDTYENNIKDTIEDILYEIISTNDEFYYNEKDQNHDLVENIYFLIKQDELEKILLDQIKIEKYLIKNIINYTYEFNNIDLYKI